MTEQTYESDAPAPGEGNYVDSLARELRRPAVFDFNGIPHLVLPRSMVAQNMERVMSAPARRTGVHAFHDAGSFVTWVNSVKRPASRIYIAADQYAAALEAVALINDDGPDDTAAGWRDFGARLRPRQSVEWERWSGHSGQRMDQMTFAAFIEDNIGDIAGAAAGDSGPRYPSGGEMLQMALNLELNQDARLRSHGRLQSGSYELKVVSRDDAATEQRMELFSRFKVGLRPFERGTAFAVEARLRYRQNEGAVAFWYELVRPDLVIAAAVAEVTAQLAAGCDLPVLYGAPHGYAYSDGASKIAQAAQVATRRG